MLLRTSPSRQTNEARSTMKVIVGCWLGSSANCGESGHDFSCLELSSSMSALRRSRSAPLHVPRLTNWTGRSRLCISASAAAAIPRKHSASQGVMMTSVSQTKHSCARTGKGVTMDRAIAAEQTIRNLQTFINQEKGCDLLPISASDFVLFGGGRCLVFHQDPQLEWSTKLPTRRASRDVGSHRRTF